METRIQYRGGTGFTAETRGHRVDCDQPPANGGADTGMTPPEFLLVSLGTCAGFYAAQYLKNPLSAAKVWKSGCPPKRPCSRRVWNFRIEVIVPGLDAAPRSRASCAPLKPAWSTTR